MVDMIEKAALVVMIISCAAVALSVAAGAILGVIWLARMAG